MTIAVALYLFENVIRPTKAKMKLINLAFYLCGGVIICGGFYTSFVRIN